jgi:hypothetical protein
MNAAEQAHAADDAIVFNKKVSHRNGLKGDLIVASFKTRRAAFPSPCHGEGTGVRLSRGAGGERNSGGDACDPGRYAG